MSKTILIIGGGIAGLAAGCYARMNGYQAKIFELHSIPGGLCTSWERKNYVLDGCISYLFGSGQGQPFSYLWQELGVARWEQFIHLDEFMRVSAADGQTLVVHSDPDQLEEHLCQLSPADARLARSLADGVRRFTRFDLSVQYEKSRELMTGPDWAGFGRKMMPFLGDMARYAMLSASDYAKQYRDPFLRVALRHAFAWPEQPMVSSLSLLASMHTRNAGFPAGGSLNFARGIEQRFRDLGGEILYQAQVEKILVEDDRAVGVRLYNDEIYRGDRVISACDGRGTLFYMLGKQFVPRKIRGYYDGHLALMPMIQVSLGVNRDLSDQPHWVTHLLDQPIFIGGLEQTEIEVKNYCFDPSLAPKGKSVVVVQIPAVYDYWQRIYGHRLYDTEQDQVAQIVLDYLETLYPGIRSQVEMVDVATPLSYERYTGNWQGSACGFLLTNRSMLMLLSGMEKTLPGLKNFYMAGQWVEPGGSVAISAVSGRQVLQMICAADGRRFETRTG